MLYLLDANTLIDANRDYYPLNAVPEFWEWLVHMGRQGRVKIPLEPWEEVANGNDCLRDWVKRVEVKSELRLDDDVDIGLVQRVTDQYATDLTETEIEQIGADPFLIAHALADPAGRCVVTTESSKPSSQRANRKDPDVCRSLGIPSCNTFQLLKDLDFSTDWNRRS